MEYSLRRSKPRLLKRLRHAAPFPPCPRTKPKQEVEGGRFYDGGTCVFALDFVNVSQM